ncbi:anhydro-N-acetylmuramic acid kinase [Paracidovorax avenae]|uniref:anhydro-N-acetylmuramic acid kinase n=1 Tax=Paracidovorax avenae TaxID=80867 RepID=UPI000D219E30|nr:anhydro-N-acetylmuramic acid kinase [Paracidovorax avenae]AVT07149.1 anhydro-N-acetylmuramic acid kinase [Paracidovorax avenae]
MTSPATTERYIGLMSGTSLDGVDGALVEFEEGMPLRVAGFASAPLPDALKAELLALNASGADELHRAALAANALAGIYAEVVQRLLQAARLGPADVQAIGAHGQTVRHRPGLFDGTGYTLQLNSPALLAERTGIAVVADFRSRDVAAGGQGAPLVPAFHQAVFGRPDTTVCVLNIGGIANLSVLGAQGGVLGFDCGPGNALMDHWCGLHTGQPYDAGGSWAAQGRVQPALLERLLSEPYLHQPPPKSTGRDLFNAAWLQSHLQELPPLPPPDVQATLTELTARACVMAMESHGQGGRQLAVCGGGARNGLLMRRLAALLPGVEVLTTDAFGLPPQQVEAAAFAWLAHRALHRLPGNLPQVTGATGPRVLGALYPA